MNTTTTPPQFTDLEIKVLKALAAGLTTAAASSSSNAKQVADDAMLDGRFGNEAIRKDPTPRFWKGESYVGARLSECPVDYLDAFAEYKDVCALMTEKNHADDPQKMKYVTYNRKDAMLARGWAARLRAQGVGTKKQAPANDDGDDEIPF